MVDMPENVLNLIRISDTFFPLGSFTVSQGMEQFVADNLFRKGRTGEILGACLEKVWKPFDYQIFRHALAAARDGDFATLLELDDLCYAAKIAEESRTAMEKMGRNLAVVTGFARESPGARFAALVEEKRAHGMYPVMLALASEALGLGEQGGISLIYVNMTEVIASLVRMAEIDYLQAQDLMKDGVRGMSLDVRGLSDSAQSFPLLDIAAMRHETNNHRMFIS
ncbi:MAG TPA: urease accessory UreF family protein [Methanoregula sp.]|nr:urease accessory UreF family protein [Methanoregula sp.]